MVELSDGRLMMWVRTVGGYMYRAVSQNSGNTWSDFEPVTSIISPLAPQSIKRLPDSSRLLCVYNDHAGQSFLKGDWWWRTPLSLAVSDNDGKDWKAVGDIEDTSSNYCYTAMLFADHKLLLSYYLSDNYIRDNKPQRYNLASLKIKILEISVLLAEN